MKCKNCGHDESRHAHGTNSCPADWLGGLWADTTFEPYLGKKLRSGTPKGIFSTHSESWRRTESFSSFAASNRLTPYQRLRGGFRN